MLNFIKIIAHFKKMMARMLSFYLSPWHDKATDSIDEKDVKNYFWVMHRIACYPSVDFGSTMDRP
jgi:hypothetical protein